MIWRRTLASRISWHAGSLTGFANENRFSPLWATRRYWVSFWLRRRRYFILKQISFLSTGCRYKGSAHLPFRSQCHCRLYSSITSYYWHWSHSSCRRRIRKLVFQWIAQQILSNPSRPSPPGSPPLWSNGWILVTKKCWYVWKSGRRPQIRSW